ncbi:autotransporter secretion inner membrane protein TamB [Acidovorax sp. 62]|uniref:translocation/assembly module TamB domain-containing protein n=1 Tax=Acidovorax sp. 62 TaxID=2035203 RepID=UPI000C184891|nr:translocation/assembly module TamB domain-containing protein [Acidovorax sp. 62]PIF91674.1 autotransporter secretion inner membrane protein TamB [Acidovorax sp. 62]
MQTPQDTSSPTPHTPPTPAAGPAPTGHPARKVLRWLLWALAALCITLACVAGAAWWWAGQSTSLATALTQVVQWLPAGQSLQSRDVTGSLRSGGRVGWLRWSSPTLAVEVTDAQLGWQLPPLLQRQLQLSTVSAARVHITPLPRPANEPPPATAPLEQLLLPLAMEVPFEIAQLQWGQAEQGSEDQASTATATDKPSASPLQVHGLAGQYRFDGQAHHLRIDHLALAQGQYTAQATLQGAAPMALQASVDGTLTTALPGRTEAFAATAHASLQGTLATAAAQLQLQADVQPGTSLAGTKAQAAAMRASVQATVQPWAAQPVQQAQATLQSVNLAALWPQAPATDLRGTLSLGTTAGNAPQPATWQLAADVTNRQPGPWDAQRLPLAQLQAQATYNGTQWAVPNATATVGAGPNAGSLSVQGRFTPASGVLEGEARLSHLSPAALHTALAAAPLSGSLQASVPSQATQTVRFVADVRAARPGATAGNAAALRIDAFSAQGQWNPLDNGGTAHIEKLNLQALQLQAQATDLRISRGPAAEAAAQTTTPNPAPTLAAQGLLNVTVPGTELRLQGQMAPRAGQGNGLLRVNDAEQTLRWLGRLPWVGTAVQSALGMASAKGQAQLQWQWNGGWHTLQQQLQAATQGTAWPAGQPAFSVQATLSTPQLETVLPASSSSNVATSIQWRAVKAELQGQMTQANLTVEGEARTGTQRWSLQTRLSGGLSAPAAGTGAGAAAGSSTWQAQWSHLRAQWQDTRQSGTWVAQLTEPWSVSLRSGAPAAKLLPKEQPRKAAAHTPQGWAVQATAGQAQIKGPLPGTVQLRWQPLRLTTVAGTLPRVQTQGTLQGLPLAWVDALSTEQATSPATGTTPSPTAPTLAPQPLLARLGLATDILLEGQWNVDTTDTPRASASLRRTQGDVRILGGDASTGVVSHSSGQGLGDGSVQAATAAAAVSTAGVRQAELSVQLQADTLSARLQWASARAGEIDASANTRIQWDQGEPPWPADAPLAGTLRARLPDVGVWSALAPPGWRVRGTLDANATLSGTRNAPRWAGTLAADDLAVRSLLDGVDLQGGRLRANLRGNQVELTEFQLQGGRGSKARITGQSGNRTAAPDERGTLSATGRLAWTDADPATNAAPRISLNLQAQAKALQVLVRADRQVSVSGNLQATLEQGQFSLTGQLTTDRATILLPDESAPTLGSDVVVRSAARDKQAQASAQAAAKAQQKAEQPSPGPTGQVTAAKPPVMAVTLNLGRDFALQGHGITTRLTGEVELRSSPTPGAPPRVTGEVRTEEGRYRAWGQVLDVETGLIRFNGPYNNPSLDILALRPNISVRAGVQVTGSALAPRVRLYSDPELPDAEKLAWVVLGRDATAGGAEAAVLQQAALTLLGNRGQSVTANLASRVGLDEIGFKSAAAGEDASAAALTFGKRLSKDLYVTYERTLSGTMGALYIFYDLSRRLTLRGQAGSNSAVDLIYTMKYD